MEKEGSLTVATEAVEDALRRLEKITIKEGELAGAEVLRGILQKGSQLFGEASHWRDYQKKNVKEQQYRGRTEKWDISGGNDGGVLTDSFPAPVALHLQQQYNAK